MVYEKVDKESGAILFKKDHESLKLEIIYKELVSLRREVEEMKSEIERLKESK